MLQLQWDLIGQRYYETGIDRGVLFPQENGLYPKGFAWSGLTAFSEAPAGAEPSPQYADNIKYLNLISAETFGGTLEAFTYPDEFEQCDGSKEVTPGVTIGQQSRKPFGFAYRTTVGNDTELNDHGYKLHLVYNAMAAPSAKAYNTVNDAPEAMTFSWEISTTPVATAHGKPTATLVIDSTMVDKDKLEAIEAVLYGTAEVVADSEKGVEAVDAVNARLPLPDEVIELLMAE